MGRGPVAAAAPGPTGSRLGPVLAAPDAGLGRGPGERERRSLLFPGAAGLRPIPRLRLGAGAAQAALPQVGGAADGGARIPERGARGQRRGRAGRRARTAEGTERAQTRALGGPGKAGEGGGGGHPWGGRPRGPVGTEAGVCHPISLQKPDVKERQMH